MGSGGAIGGYEGLYKAPKAIKDHQGPIFDAFLFVLKGPYDGPYKSLIK